MHFEILVEDQSGKKFLDIVVPKLVGQEHTFRVHPYKGIGKIPQNLAGNADASKRILLDRLPQLLKGYGRAFSNYPNEYTAIVLIICDIDNRCHKEFRKNLLDILDSCDPKPEAYFCFAVEEGEAWFLGDIPAIKNAYPRANDAVLKAYVNDSICGTWECLADAIYPGGSQSLSQKGWQAVGTEKSKWAEKITPNMIPNNNNSPSFCYFRDKIRSILVQEKKNI